MKVLVLGLDLRDHGGVQRYSRAFVRAFEAALGPDNVRALAPTDTGIQPALARKLLFAVRAAWAALIWRPDVVFCAHLHVAPVARLLRVLGGPRYWVLCHGIEVWGLLTPGRARALASADKLLANSAFTAKVVAKRHGARVDPDGILACPVDDALAARAQDAAVLQNVPAGARVILTVARLSPDERYKGHDAIVDALPALRQRFPGICYLVVGGGEDAPWVLDRATARGVREALVVTGPIDDAQLAACYARADVFAMPSRTDLDQTPPSGEGFGIAYIEAMAFGKPVVAPIDGAPAEIVRDGVDGLLVDPRDPAAVGEAIATLLSSPAKATEMGQNAKARAAEYAEPIFQRKVRALLEATR